jgi:hypothetical protein
MPSPFHGNLYARSQELMDDARDVELYANLLHSRTRYERILADWKAVEPALSDVASRSATTPTSTASCGTSRASWPLSAPPSAPPPPPPNIWRAPGPPGYPVDSRTAAVRAVG